MPTDAVFKKMVREVVSEEIESQFGLFKLEVISEVQKIGDKLLSDVSRLVDEAITSNDKVAKLLKTDQEEHEILNGRSAKINQIEDEVEELKAIHPHGQHATA